MIESQMRTDQHGRTETSYAAVAGAGGQGSSPESGEAAPAHGSFFRQSGWLMMSTIAGGMLMWAVHFLSKKISQSEYANFGTYVAVLMFLPDLPLQMVMAHQTALALASGGQRRLSGIIRWVALVLFILWLGAVVGVAARQSWILEHYHLPNATGLWLTMGAVLFSLWMPMLGGVLQGQQNFLWLGWNQVSNGFGRLGIAAFAVLVLSGGSTGMMAGALSGVFLTTTIAAWQTRPLWALKPAPFDSRSLLREILPLAIGFIGFKILFLADIVFVKANFEVDGSQYPAAYTAAGTLSRALMWLVLPLASVMFPRLVHSAARKEKTNLMGLVFWGTAGLAVSGVLFLKLAGPLLVKLVYTSGYVDLVCRVLPWYAAAMVPIALANVLLNNLLSKPASKLPASLCILALAIGYLFALRFAVGRWHELETVLKTMGLFNLCLLGLCATFIRLSRKEA